MIKETNKFGNWTEGTLKVGNKSYQFAIKHFDDPSKYGIRNGRISKMVIQDASGKIVVSYDRGWDVRPKKDAADAVGAIMKKYDPVVYKKAYAAAKRRSLMNDLKLPTQKMLDRGLKELKKLF